MAAIVQTHPQGTLEPPAARWLVHVRERIASFGLHPSRNLVLLPSAHLLAPAAQAWARLQPAGFSPRFETAATWSRSIGFAASAEDITFDLARDLLTARMLVEREGLAAQADLLAARVAEAAHQLAKVAACVAQPERAAFERRARAVLGESFDLPQLSVESSISRIALRWACASSFASDVLLDAQAGAPLDRVFLVEGLAEEPFHRVLESSLGAKAERVALVEASAPTSPVHLHECADASEEAERAAAAVLAHVQAGRVPVAIVAVDRALTRRIRALLDGRGLALRDETGWKLSTTRSAAQVMLALRACAHHAATDGVLDWLKHCASATRGLASLERALRRGGQRAWADVRIDPEAAAALSLFDAANSWREPFQGSRTLVQWLAALRELLQSTGQWPGLSRDAAGVQVIAALRLDEGSEGEFRDLPQAARRFTLSQFTNWADAVLESQSYRPLAPDEAKAVILPLGQMAGRSFAAAVIAGCDEERLPLGEDPPGIWSPSQRRALGLPTRESAQAQLRAAWGTALRVPVCDVLWRRPNDSGEALLPSALVQALRLKPSNDEAANPAGDTAAGASNDARITRTLAPAPVARPAAIGSRVPIAQLSPTAYEDLRRCPYRFFALRQLALQEPDEIDVELDKSDFGNWLHQVLREFHEALQAQPLPHGAQRSELFDRIAKQVAAAKRLEGGEFLPFISTLPALRDGYLAWLEEHEAGGAVFEVGESDRTAEVAGTRVFGRLDRIDTAPGGVTWVIDYKTESLDKTKARMKVYGEDTQVAFYAALLGARADEGPVRGGYLNIGERGDTNLVEQPGLDALRSDLLDSVARDLARIAGGQNLHALGEGQACEYCAARGLCRRDSWEK